MGVNYIIAHWPWRLDFAVSWHWKFMPLFIGLRKAQGRNRPVTYSSKEGECVDVVGRYKWVLLRNGRSGMYAVCLGLHLGYDKIVVAGMPFDFSGTFYSSPEIKTRFDMKKTKRIRLWNEVKEMAGDRVRFVSGDLVPFFGEFTEEWLERN